MWTDSPIASAAEDQFDRKPYAVHAARLIASTHSWNDSVVFGLTGPWGSGKSSMLTMITEELSEVHPEWCVARFTPWATGDVSGLLGDFYATLSKALPDHVGRKVRQGLGTLLQVAAPAAAAVPWGGGAIEMAARTGGQALKKQKPFDVAFKVAADELEKLKIPVLLIADDIDRLQTEELLALLKVVRLLGRFPGVDYLLAYDEATLFQALSHANLVGADDGGAGRFMEKIVQYPLVVPPLLQTQLLTRLDHGLHAAFAETGRTPLTSRRLGHLEAVFRSLLFTPRAIDRFLAQLHHHLPLVAANEINDEDVVVLTLFRTAFPTVYQQLPRWREQLLSGNTGEVESYNPIKYKAFEFDELLATIPGFARADARALLVDLFPRLSGKGMTYGDRDLGISSPRYFDRYFAMAIPAHDIPDAVVAAAIESAAHGAGESLRLMLAGTSAERASLVIEKGYRVTDAYSTSSLDDGPRLQLVRILLAVYAEVADQKSYFFSPRDRVMGWAASLLKGLSTNAAGDEVLAALGGTNALSEKLHAVYEAIDTEQQQPEWAAGVVGILSEQAIEAFMTNLRQRDAANETDSPRWMALFVLRFDGAVDLAGPVQAGLAANEFTIADLAARFVGLRTLVGVSEWELGDFDQDSFATVAPSTPDAWFDLPRVEVDVHDIGWANRRLYATGRAKRPGA